MRRVLVRMISLLGHLLCKKTGLTFPLSDLTIGLESSCSIMLPGREVSRLHARVFLREGKVIMELARWTRSGSNGNIVNQVASLKEGDSVQLWKEVVVWHRKEVKHKEEISVDTVCYLSSTWCQDVNIFAMVRTIFEFFNKLFTIARFSQGSKTGEIFENSYQFGLKPIAQYVLTS